MAGEEWEVQAEWPRAKPLQGLQRRSGERWAAVDGAPDSSDRAMCKHRCGLSAPGAGRSERGRGDSNRMAGLHQQGGEQGGQVGIRRKAGSQGCPGAPEAQKKTTKEGKPSLCWIRKPSLENQKTLPKIGHQCKLGFEPSSKSPSFKSCWGGEFTRPNPGPPISLLVTHPSHSRPACLPGCALAMHLISPPPGQPAALGSERYS